MFDDFCAYPRCSNPVEVDVLCAEHAARLSSSVPVTFVFGPPCSGKTTMVNEARRPTDLVFDLDAVAEAMGAPSRYERPDSFVPFLLATRAAIIERLRQPSDLSGAWVIATAPCRKEREFHMPWAKRILLTTPREECHMRADRAGRPEKWHRIIDQYFADFEPPH